jgi:Cdc6-like AAA superfamily ATPase
VRRQDNTTIIPLRRDFRFIHEPVHYSKRGAITRFVGRDRELDELTQRIFYADGGSFLVTGYRGVGKTSFVNQTIKQIEQLTHTFESALGPTRVLHIHLNLARPLTPAELMYHIIRSLYQELEQQRLLGRLDRSTREALALAVQRTSMNVTRTSERSGEIGYDLSKLVTNIQAISAISGVLSGKVSRSQKLDLNYLAYDEKSAEYDLIQLAGRLIHSYRERRGLRRRRVRLKIIFVFDELDKLEGFTTANGAPVIDDILSVLKNLFTTSGLFFIFIAGRDLQERLTEDIGRGDSIYESVFTYAIYLPAMWADIDAICNELLAPAPSNVGIGLTGVAIPGSDVELFKQYLAYKGRGIPRRILRGFNQSACAHSEITYIAVFWSASRPRFSMPSG